mmetsp:Transcript_19172/g.32904  ORF Transcript_19172/g.32904 Transcript_19172/m.32904 type:complete len:83 (-) Transcript_19172:206-454(-)
MLCAICAGSGGEERSGMPGMLFIPERREDMSGGDEVEEESPLVSDPPRGMRFHDDDEVDDDRDGLGTKLRRVARCMADDRLF